jgi:hypothetical protein
MYRILICKIYNLTSRATLVVNTEMWEGQRRGQNADDRDDAVCAEQTSDAI